VDADPDAGFDISYSLTSAANQGYADLGIGGARSLYQVDMLT
jgi:hypothetical protein